MDGRTDKQKDRQTYRQRKSNDNPDYSDLYRQMDSNADAQVSSL